jgi:flagellar basal-body rod protein FlgB
MINGLDSLFSFHETALKVREQRQELIASNIANSDTPNYKARDLDFASAMSKALAANAAAASTTPLAASSAKHLSGNSAPDSGTDPLADVLYRASIQSSVDGNTVDGDVERNAFTDNAIRYEASLTMLKGNIKDMLSALQG